MSMNPQEIHLSPEQRRRLVELSEQTGRSWSELLDDALQHLSVHETDAGQRLRRILDDLGKHAASAPDAELDDAMDEALRFARHHNS